MVGRGRRLALRALRLVALCGAIVAGWYVFSYRRDWFFFHLHRHDVVRSLPEFRARLAASGLPVGEIGRVRYGSEEAPIWAVRRPSTQASTQTVCLMAGVHGNEPAGPETLVALSSRLHRDAAFLPAFHVVLVPLVNPWGWARDLRHNGDNRDVARQFVDGQAQEAEAVKTALRAAHCDLLIDLHEDRVRTGFYLLAYDEPDLPGVEAAIRRAEAATGVMRAARPKGGLYRIGGDALDAVQQTTASLWARQSGVPHALIVETHDGLLLETRVAVQTEVVLGLVRLLETDASRGSPPVRQ